MDDQVFEERERIVGVLRKVTISAAREAKELDKMLPIIAKHALCVYAIRSGMTKEQLDKLIKSGYAMEKLVTSNELALKSLVESETFIVLEALMSKDN